MMIGLLLAAQLYMVKAGDTLWGIAGNQWPVVCQENRISDCNLIYPGQVLNVSDTAATSARIVASDSDNGIFRGVPDSSSSLSGTLSCSGLESLWMAAGGSQGAAFVAAEIAMAESGGQQYATGPVGEEGYWQINPVNGDATYSAIGNAQAAIYLSGNGADWSPWTTYTTGAYYGRC